MAPLHDITKGLTTAFTLASVQLERLQLVAQHVANLLYRQCSCACCSQFDSQWQAIEQLANLSNCRSIQRRVKGHARSLLSGAQKQFGRVS